MLVDTSIEVSALRELRKATRRSELLPAQMLESLVVSRACVFFVPMGHATSDRLFYGVAPMSKAPVQPVRQRHWRFKLGAILQATGSQSAHV